MSPRHVIFKKVSKDKSVTVYMDKRDYVDHCDFVDPVDGVVLIDPVQLKGKKVYVMLSCTFRYGRQDTDMLGLAFKRDIFVVTRQAYPALQERLTHTKIQQKLLKKLGDYAFPFFFEFPDNLPCSVALQPGPSDVGKKCAVEFEVKAFCSEHQDEKIDKQSSVRLAIRKIQYAPVNTKLVPSAETTFEFLMSDKPLNLKLSLQKETYYHGEPIKATLEITNSSNRNIKNISISVEQVTNVVLYSNDKYTKSVAKEQTSDTVPSATTLKKDYMLYPVLAQNKDRHGLALDGKLKHEDTNLASSSIVKEEVLKEVQGMLVSYKVVVRMSASGMIGSSEVSVEVPFRLMHPSPKLGTKPSTLDLILNLPSTLDPILNLPSTLDLILNLPSTLDPILNLPCTLDPILNLPSTLDPILNLPSTLDPILNLPSTLDPILNLPCTLDLILNLPSTLDPILNLPCTLDLILNLPCTLDPILNLPCTLDLILNLPSTLDLILNLPCTLDLIYTKESESDDMVFEEFKRAYLKGIIGDGDESPTEA
ncbi:S-arrestin-like [Polymixia lowei]